VLVAERRRLAHLIAEGLDTGTHAVLRDLLVREGRLSELAALKQDAKHFGYQMMVAERQKHAALAPLHAAAKAILPRLGISQQNTIYKTQYIMQVLYITIRYSICVG
jgi:hypothetical protein